MDPRLKVIIEVLDRATKPLANMHRQMMSNVRRIQIALLAAGATLAAFIALAIKGSEAQRSAMARLEAHSGRLGPAMAAAVTEISKQYGRLLGFTRTQIADILVLLSQLFGPQVASQIAGAIMILARVLNVDLATAADIFRDALAGDADAIAKLLAVGIKLEDMSDPMRLATAITKVLADRAKDATASTALLGAAWTDLLATLGGGKDGPFSVFVETLATMLTKIDDFLVKHPAFVEALNGIALAAAGLITVFGLLLAWFLAIMVLAPVWGLVVAALTSPIGLVILIILGLILMGWKLHDEWQKIWGDNGTTTWEKTGLIILSILRIFPQIDMMITAIKQLRKDWADAWEFMQTETGRNILRMLGPIGTLIDMVWRAISALQQLGALERKSSIRSSGVSRSFAEGSVMPSTGLATVRERGPELVALPVDSRVFPNRALAGAGGSGGNFVVNGNIYGVENLRALVIQWVRETRTGGGFQT